MIPEEIKAYWLKCEYDVDGPTALGNYYDYKTFKKFGYYRHIKIACTMPDSSHQYCINNVWYKEDEAIRIINRLISFI